MGKKSILFDLDGVLVDLHSELENRLHKMGYTEFSMMRVLTYDFNKSLEAAPEFLKESNIPNYEYYINAPRNVIFDLLGDITLFENAKLHNNIVEDLIELSKHYDIGFHSFALNTTIANQKANLINSCFSGLFKYNLILSTGVKKSAILGYDYIVEDNIFDLTDYAKFTTSELFIIDKPYNQEKFNKSNDAVFNKAKRVCSVSCVKNILLDNKEVSCHC